MATYIGGLGGEIYEVKCEVQPSPYAKQSRLRVLFGEHFEGGDFMFAISPSPPLSVRVHICPANSVHH